MRRRIAVRRRRRGLVCVLALAVIVASAPTAAAASGTARGSTSPRILGATPGDAPVEFDLVLDVPDEAELHAFVARVNDPKSPDYHRYLTPDEIGRRFGISDAALTRVESWVTSMGMHVVEGYPQRTSLRVAGTAATVNRAFHVQLIDRMDPATHERYHAPRGDAAVPRALAGAVDAIAGLDTRPLDHLAPRVAPRAGLSSCQSDPQCYSPERLARTFDFAGIHADGMQGQGETVAVIMDGKVSDQDIDQWATSAGLANVEPVKRITVGGGPDADEANSAESIAEGTMDVETVLAVAPKAQVLYYFAPLDAFGDAVDAVVQDKAANVVTYSAGACDEARLSNPDARAARTRDARAVEKAAGVGVNVLVSSGDSGAYTCSRSNPDDWRVTGTSPSDFPYTLSVGGTFVERRPDGTYVDEAAWEWPFANAGTGGGLNPVDDRPAWQRGPGVDNASSNGKRQFPDVAAPADPLSGWYIVVNGKPSEAGGTSASSPFWAGLLALYDEMAKRAGMQGIGLVAPTLYAVAAAAEPDTVFHDVVRGGNLFYEATPGWDYATGLGTPIGSKLGAAIVEYLKAHPGAPTT
ncbi:MAG TPA: S53 family peptidase [Acidimicrobiia bacterium]|nr:S53 family peptidase [Acidimicrobiia bacterium]